MLNRRSLFGTALPALGLLAAPAAAHAAQLIPPQAEAAAFETGLALINPLLVPLARQGVDDGWKLEEVFCVTNTEAPSLLFARTISELPSEKEGFEGFIVKTTRYATYRHGCEVNDDTSVTATNPNRRSR